MHRVTFLAALFAVAIVGSSALAQETEKTWQQAIREFQYQPRPPVTSYKPVPTTRYTTVYDSLVAYRGTSHLGMSLEAADDTLRSQLGLTKGQGLVVTGVTPKSAAAKAGIKKYDILLKANGKPITKPGDLPQPSQKAAGEKTSIDLLRGGKHHTYDLTAAAPPTKWDVVVTVRQYRIGVSLGAISDALRAQLQIPKGQGVVVSQTVKDSPAAKAGMQVNDLVLNVSGKPVSQASDLQTAVRNSKGKPVSIILLRGGKLLTVTLTPEKQDGVYSRWWSGPGSSYVNPLTYDQLKGFHYNDYRRKPLPASEVQKQFDSVLKQLDALRQSVETLRHRIPPEPKKKETPTPDDK